MNKRLRKKYLKKQGLYVEPHETWNLDIVIAKYIVPRLKLFKKLNNGYPGKDEMDTSEKWDEALDKMIRTFELLAIDNGIYGLDIHDSYFKEKFKEKQKYTQEGLQLFAKWYEWLSW